MADKYKFDPESLQFTKQSTKSRFIKTYLRVIVSGIIIGIVFLFVSAYIITTPGIRKLRRENTQAGKDVKKLTEQYERMEKVLNDLEKRDENIYKAVLESDPKENVDDTLTSEVKMVVDMLETKSFIEIADFIQNEIEATLKSIRSDEDEYKEFAEVLRKKANMLLHIPSIQPVKNPNLEIILYGFGKRIDPFYKSPKDHKGLDYSLPEGTRVFATANGRVSFVGRKRRKGNVIEIDHGYGFRTVYAHLDKMLVHNGEKLERGHYIGTVGNTGKSITPHLHYEVIVNNREVNPVNFFFADISPQQYEQLILFSSRGGVSLD